MLGVWWRKAVECACNTPRDAVCEWKSWDGGCVKALLPHVLHLEARPEHECQDVMRLLPATVRRFPFHLDLGETSRFPDGRRLDLPSAEVSPDGVCEELLIVKSDFNYGVRISLDRYVFSTGVSPRPLKTLTRYSGCMKFFLGRGGLRDELPAAPYETAYRFAEGFGRECGSLDMVPDDQADFFMRDANTKPGMGHAVEERMKFPREPWEWDPQ
jgi:hypothetical protein